MDEHQKHTKRPRDVNVRAASTVSLVTGEDAIVDAETPNPKQPNEVTAKGIHTAAVTLGRKGGQSRAKRLSSEQRGESAKKAAAARWDKKP